MKTHEHTIYYTGVLSKMEETFNNLVSFKTVFDFRMFFFFRTAVDTLVCFTPKRDRVDPDPFPASARA